MKNSQKSPLSGGGYGPHTQVKYQLKTLILGTCKKNILILQDEILCE